MVSCGYIHKEFRYRIDAYNLSKNNYPTTVKIDSVVNRAVSIWYKENIKIAEVDEETRELLRPFIVPDKKLDFKRNGNEYIAQYPDDFYQKSYYKVFAKKKECEEVSGKKCRKNLVPHPIQGDDFNFAIKDPDRKPSYRYESILYSEKSDGIHFYLGDDEMDIVDIKLDYYKMIPKIQCPKQLRGAEYVNTEGKVVKRNIDLPDMKLNSEDDILDIAAVLYLTRINNKEELSNRLLLIKEKYKL